MAATRSLFARDDTFFGVCAAIGQDFGFNPVYLRIAFAAPFMWNPTVVIAAYLAIGVVVLAARLLFPAHRRAANATARPAIETPRVAKNDDHALALAA